METPKVCIIACGDSLSELVVREALKELGSDVALCPLSAVATGVEGIKDAMKKAEYVMVVDSCSEECGRKLAETFGIHYDEYLNLEEELGIKMPCYKKPSVEVVDDVGLAAAHLIERIREVLKEL
ncbi:putative zinc-binding protein [Palaeococcus ferrophilus]|uniref:putative zinc-binding protein n=1 Tax=Palaeococcus ferrophilus TaxID=83868 RepID=UPI00064F6E1F|nr:putative zinc-binding protein [Palaeococcus ferrophilus]